MATVVLDEIPFVDALDLHRRFRIGPAVAVGDVRPATRSGGSPRNVRRTPLRSGLQDQLVVVARNAGRPRGTRRCGSRHSPVSTGPRPATRIATAMSPPRPHASEARLNAEYMSVAYTSCSPVPCPSPGPMGWRQGLRGFARRLHRGRAKRVSLSRVCKNCDARGAPGRNFRGTGLNVHLRYKWLRKPNRRRRTLKQLQRLHSCSDRGKPLCNGSAHKPLSALLVMAVLMPCRLCGLRGCARTRRLQGAFAGLCRSRPVRYQRVPRALVRARTRSWANPTFRWS